MELQQSSIDQLTVEILVYKQQAAVNIIEIGRRLMRAKEVLPHGAWGKWLEERVEFTDRTAQRFMRAAKEFSNATAMSGLSQTKVFAILDVPAEEREQFIERPHELPTGETKTVNEMTTRELQDAIRSKKAAEKAAADAKAEIERLARDNATLRQANKELENVKPEVVEKEVVPQGVQDELTRLQADKNRLQNKNLQLEARLCTSEMDPAERLKKARLSQKALDDELLWLNGRIKSFLKEVAPYIYVADSFMNMGPAQVKEHEDALIKLGNWLATMRQAMPYGGEVIDTKGVITDG